MLQTTLEKIYSEKFNKGFIKGTQKGIAAGIKKSKLKAAESLLSRNMPVNEIIEITGLSEKEIIRAAKIIITNQAKGGCNGKRY